MQTDLLRGSAIAAMCMALAVCLGQPWGPPSDSLSAARRTCNLQYPRKIGNYLPHAAWVNDAIERLAIP